MIRTYANTKAEQIVAEARLDLLKFRKEKIYTKYFPLTSNMEISSSHTNKKTDAMASYLSEMTKVNKISGMSLEEEIEEQQNEVNKLKYYIRVMEYTLKKTTGIENELFYKIVVDGLKRTEAVEMVAEKHDKEPRWIWKNYYPKIKKEILKCSVKVQ